jgi:hypothetical protein
MRADRQRLDLKIEARKPQHIGILIALRLSLVFVVTLSFMSVVPQIIYGGPLGVSLSFLFLIIWAGLVYLTVNSIIGLFQTKGFNPAPFFVVYAAWVSLLLAVGSTFNMTPLPLLGMTVLQFFIACLIIEIAYTKKLANSWKLAILCAMWTVAFIFAVVFSLSTFS